MTLDEVISQVEAQLVDRSVDAVKAAIAALAPGFLAWLLTPFGNFIWNIVLERVIRWLAGIVVKFLDNKGYYLYKTVTNNADAGRYEDTIRNERAAVASGDQNAIAQARAAKRAAFLKLFPLTA